MPIHDWTRVPSGIFHAFHLSWLAELNRVLNRGLLPPGFYALPEQHAGSSIPDILTLHATDVVEPLPPAPNTGGTAVAEVPPQAQRKQTVGATARSRRRTLAIRHVSGHRLVAILEIVSPSNKDRLQSVAEFASKIVNAIDYGIHVLLIDLLPPGLHDPNGMHGAIWQRLEQTEEPYDLPANRPFTIGSYAAGDPVEIFLNHPGIGSLLPKATLFLRHDRYIETPLEETYQEAFLDQPSVWRDVLELP